MASGVAFVTFLLMVVLILGIPVLGVVLIVRMIVNRREVEHLSEEEQLQFRRMMEALTRMEDRVANLETILMQREGDQRPAGGEPRPAEQQWPFKS